MSLNCPACTCARNPFSRAARRKISVSASVNAMFSQNASTASIKPRDMSRSSHGPLASATKSARRSRYSGGSACSPRKVVRIVTGSVAAQGPRHLEHPPLGVEIQAITRFHFEGGDALRHQSRGPNRSRRHEFYRIRGAGGADGRLDAAAGARDLLVRHPAQPLLELLHPVARVHQVRVAIDQSRRHPQACALLDRDVVRCRPVPGLRGRPEPRDAPVFDGQRVCARLTIGVGARDHRRDAHAHPYPVPLAPDRCLHACPSSVGGAAFRTLRRLPFVP